MSREATPESPRLPANVWIAGLVSFFTDIASEMCYPLLHAFLAAVPAIGRGLAAPALGAIEAVAGVATQVGRLASGWLSDRSGRRKTLTIAGYSLSAGSRPLLLLAALWWPALIIWRFLDRTGKGVRSAPRDALIADSVEPRVRGAAFGVQRALDFSGAMVGSGIAWCFARAYLDDAQPTPLLSGLRLVFAISIIPAVLAVAMLLLLRETGPLPKAKPSMPAMERAKLPALPQTLWFFLLIQATFALGSSSDQFLLLRSATLSGRLSDSIVMYILFNASAAGLAPLFGRLSDRVGRRPVLLGGYLIYALCYTGFGFCDIDRVHLLWALWPIYGVYYAMTEGVEKAMVVDLAPAETRATAIAIYQVVQAAGLFLASLLAGLLYTLSPEAPFFAGAGLSALAALLLLHPRLRRHP